MAFVRTIEDDVFRADTFRRGEEWSIIVNIGYDDATGSKYSFVVGLSPMAGGPIEYFFHIVEVDGETGEEHAFWSGVETSGFLKGEDRRIVRGGILAATKALLDNARPERVEMVSYDANPPDKALLKHEMIGHVFETAGYVVRNADPFHGKRVWWMDRRPER